MKIMLNMIKYYFTDEEAGSSSSNIETLCTNTLNIENTQEESTVLEITTFNERDVIHIDEAKESGTQTSLSLSSLSPRKAQLYQQIKGYKRKIANLKLQLQQAKRTKKRY